MAIPEERWNWEEIRSRTRKTIIGARKNIEDPNIFHKIALIPVLAWIGLGADGISSSSYGPPEAFIALGNHAYLAIFLALGTALTVFIISYAYTRIIEHFPGGGGGYIVANHTISEQAGVVSGSALLIDYMLTITVSIAACADAIFSFLPLSYQPYKLAFGCLLILILIELNLRGVKESVKILAPIFFVFIAAHLLLLGYGIFAHAPRIAPVAAGIQSSFSGDLSTIGIIGVLAIILRAYSLGGGTYTGIEAVANGMQIMREPRVKTGKRTMAYMAVSLAAISGGLFLCYLLWNVHPVAGQTLNAVLATNVFGGLPFGQALALVTIFSEGALLCVAAQTGFIDGPRVMANMAIDSWLPRSFALLSERFTMIRGVILMGGVALLLLLITQGSVVILVTMYAINVFITFSISQFGMARFFYKRRDTEEHWKRHIPIHIIGFLLCVTILIITLYEKLGEGGWLTLLMTSVLICVCFAIHRHYSEVARWLRKLDVLLDTIPSTGVKNIDPVNTHKMTAVQLVTGFNGFGVNTFYSIAKNFPGVYENFIFVSIAVVDSGTFKGTAEVHALAESTESALLKYVDLARDMGFAADYRMDLGTDVVNLAVPLCKNIAKQFPNSTFFTGQLVFRHENPFQRILHNETAFAIQRRLHYSGITTVILPVQAER
ncbi:APC family permease [Methanoregula sp.]|uniref:APC family permease n=1 Tax=Methanoregula sp. TaxID=2052170 RepID=UPI003C78BED9